MHLPAFGRLRQEDSKFKAILGYTVRRYHKKQNKKGKDWYSKISAREKLDYLSLVIFLSPQISASYSFPCFKIPLKYLSPKYHVT
jgi:hypothetical protein